MRMLSDNTFYLIVKSDDLAEDVVFLARSLGFGATCHKCKKSCPTRTGKFTGIYNRICISGDIERIPVRVPRRKATARKQIKNVLYTGITVEPVPAGEFFGFELDGDHLFLLGDFTVTHNSHIAKALGNEMGIPSYTMDIGEVMEGIVGQSEHRMMDTLKVVDAMAPCLLIMDEIEKGFSGVASSHMTDGGTTSRMFGMFLKWMQDHSSRVIVVATCNNMDILPAEFLRAGRWDNIFFVGMPTRKEREGIIAMYKKAYKVKGETPDISGWTGAEIKQLCVTASMLGLPIDQAIKMTIPPLIVSQKEKMDFLIGWAKSRSVPASDPEEAEVSEIGDVARKVMAAPWDKSDAK
jgi:hypothetical protein